MGIRTWPGYELFGNDSDCFDPDHTPKKVYVTVSGVTLCDYIPLANKKYSPNRSFVLDQTANPNVWLYNEEGYWCYYATLHPTMIPPSSLLTIGTPAAPGYAFYGFDDPCKTYFRNALAEIDCEPALVTGYEGSAQVFWRPEDSSPSIRGIMEKINMTPEKQTFCEAWPIDADNFAVRLARQQDGTCIYVKFEHTL